MLTSSSNYLSELVAAELGFDEVCCNRLEVDPAGLHTGRVVGGICFGPGKLPHAQAAATGAGASMSTATFYTDSYSDLAVLEAVAHPVAVNPDPRLRRLAQRRGWRVVDWGIAPGARRVSSPFSRWTALDAAERRVALDAALEQLPAWLELVDAEAATPRFVDRRHGEGWRLFAGGPFAMGATAERVEATEAVLAQRLDLSWSAEVHGPPRALALPPFLLMEEPVRGQDGDATWYLGDVVRSVTQALAERGVRLPSDAEWEYAHRAVLAAPGAWRTGEMELCADGWRPSLEALPADGSPVPGGPAVCREGSLDPADVEYLMPARFPLASVRLVQLRAALDVPLTPR
jgi:hypothetical protein